MGLIVLKEELRFSKEFGIGHLLTVTLPTVSLFGFTVNCGSVKFV